jgi:hypothetical protein
VQGSRQNELDRNSVAEHLQAITAFVNWQAKGDRYYCYIREMTTILKYSRWDGRVCGIPQQQLVSRFSSRGALS